MTRYDSAKNSFFEPKVYNFPLDMACMFAASSSACNKVNVFKAKISFRVTTMVRTCPRESRERIRDATTRRIQAVARERREVDQ